MAYREDCDLEFLANCSDEDLARLVRHLTIDQEDGKPRRTEELTKTDAYKRYHPQHSKYWKEIAAEIQCFGANSIATVFRRGEGVLYKEVLCNVCDKLKVDYKKGSSCEKIEAKLLEMVFDKVVDKMSDEERENLANELGMEHAGCVTSNALKSLFSGLSKKCNEQYKIIAEAVATAVLGFVVKTITTNVVGGVAGASVAGLATKTIGTSVASFASSAGAGLASTGAAVAANATVGRLAGILAGPVGWIATVAWAAVDIAGPAFRVTIPAVIEIANLRIKSK